MARKLREILDDNPVAMGLALADWGWRPSGFDTVTIKEKLMNLQSHLDALKGRHANLETRIAAEDSRPRPDDTALARMKVEKLRLKEEMERLKTQ